MRLGIAFGPTGVGIGMVGMNLPVAAYFAASSGEADHHQDHAGRDNSAAAGDRRESHGLYPYYQLMARLRIDLIEERLIPATPMPQ